MLTRIAEGRRSFQYQIPEAVRVSDRLVLTTAINATIKNNANEIEPESEDEPSKGERELGRSMEVPDRVF